MDNRVASRLERGEVVGSEVVERMRASLGGEPSLLVVFASPRHDLAAVLAAMRAAAPGVVVLGASSSGEFSEEGDAGGAVSVLGLAGEFRVVAGMGEGLRASPEQALAEALHGLPREMEGYPFATGILLMDALAGHGEETTMLASMQLGEGVKLVGGAAGDDLRMERTVVGLNGSVRSDALVLALIFSRRPLGVGVHHGHEPISGPLRVTRAEGSVVHEIDGRPAWDVWCEQTRATAARRGIDVSALSHEDEGGFLLRFEAGLSAGASYKIRAPLRRLEGGALLFASEVPQGSVIRITESVAERQVESAREAARQARAGLSGPAAGALVFDCICRKLILGDRFATAVAAMSQELDQAPLAGFETYGEVALAESDLSGFHNTTSVVLAFPR